MLAALICALLFVIASCGNDKDADTPTEPNAPSTGDGTGTGADGEEDSDIEELPASEGLRFELNSDRESYSVRALGSCTDTDIVIPSTYNGKPVTGINANLFSPWQHLTSLTIPNSIKNVGVNAFPTHEAFKYNEYDNAYYLGNKSNPYLYLVKAKNTDITSVNIHSNTKFIYSDAFSNCSQLTSVTIPDGVTGIGEGAFFYCWRLSNIAIPDSVTEIGESAFTSCYSLSKVTLPESITGISPSAFSYCYHLTDIIIPDSVTEIGDDAFNACNDLNYTEYNNAYYLGNEDNPYLFLMKAKDTDITSVTVHSSTKNIYQNAFKDCKSLKSVTVPSSVARIGYSAFSGCTALKSVYISDIASWCKIKFDDVYSNPVTIANNLYLKNSLIKKLTLPNGMTEISDYALHNCKSMTEIKIPNSVTRIGAQAFSGCTGLEKINVPDSVTSIGNQTFSSSNSINYNEYDNAYYIGNDANPYLILVKAKDKKITSVQIHSDTKFIHSYAFYNCNSLASVTILGSIKKIYSEAFSYCNELTSIEIPDGITDIEDRAFSCCKGLTSVTIGSGLTNISEYAFISCRSLTSLTLPEELTTVESYAFSYCEELTHITFKGTIAQWNMIYKYGGLNSSIKRICCSDGDIVL